MKKCTISEMKLKDLSSILALLKQLNPNLSIETLESRIIAMFEYSNYKCLGFYHRNKLIGLTGCWTTVRIYSGKQLELDNIIIDNGLQSKGFGKIFISLIEKWAIVNDYKTVELHTYIENDKSHKFYFNQEFRILGFHFQKQINIK